MVIKNGQPTGYKEVLFDEKEMAEFYVKPQFKDLKNKQYLIVKDKHGAVVDKYRNDNGFLRKVDYPYIENNLMGKIKPRNLQQELAMDMLHDEESKVKLLAGVFGSGKDYLMVAKAFDLIQREEYDKIVYVRNGITVADAKDPGSLPGDLYEKQLVHLMPLADHLGGVIGLDKMIGAGKVEPQHLAFIRGRSYSRSIIYVTEAENLTLKNIQLLLGRVGEGSALWLNGDFRQRDSVAFEKSKGLEKMIEVLSGNPLFGYVYMPKSERSSVAELANLLD